MQRKISIIIATDFFCWVPFVIVCCLHSLEVLDATPWYALFSIIILPINSVINPLLYDNTITSFISRSASRLHSFIMSIITSPDTTLPEVHIVNNPCCNNEIMELEVIKPKKNTVLVDDCKQRCSPKSHAPNNNMIFVEDGEQACSSKMYQETLC